MSEHLRLIKFEPAHSPQPLSAVEARFSRIANELGARWRSGQIDEYMDSLLIDTRGDRQGFPADVLDELMFLSGLRWQLRHEFCVPLDTMKPEGFSFCASNEEDLRRCGTSGAWVLV